MKKIFLENKEKILEYSGMYLWPVLTLLLTGTALVLFQWVILGQLSNTFKVGAPSPETYRAVSPMRYDDKTASNTLKEMAAERVVSVTVRDMSAKARLRRRLEELGTLKNNSQQQNNNLYLSFLPEPLVNAIANLSRAERFRILNLTSQVGSAYIDKLEEQGVFMDSAAETALLWSEINRLSLPANDANFIYQILSRLGNLNFSSDAELTEMARRTAVNDIPLIERRLEIGDVIIARDEIVTNQAATLLRLQGYPEDVFPATQLAIVIILSFLLPLWLDIPVHDIKDNRPSKSCVVFVILLAWILETLSAKYLDIDGAGIVPAVLMAYLCMSGSFAFSTALAAAGSGALVITGLAISNFILILSMSVIASTLGFYLLTRLESRGQISRQIIIFTLIMAVFRLVIRYLQGMMPDVNFTFNFDAAMLFAEYGFFIFAELVTCFCVISILPVIENYIGVLSVLRLRELSHPSSPLLRTMQREAPGTYQHCLTIASLAEAVAPELNMDVNLMKTGAYYHDIGKMRRPHFFVENQGGGINTHDAMSPRLSAITIIAHVKDGLDLAWEAKLPKRIRDFIAEHHGTTCVRYFYNKACAVAKPGEKVEWSDFCYPGPRPQSRETALLMIIDSIEAAVRSANLGRRPSASDSDSNSNSDPNHPNKGRSQYILALQQIISQVVNSKINEGQFDDVNFTQKDLTKIKGALLSALLSMYHTRSVKKIEKK